MEPVIVPRSEHTISRKLIDPDAVKVLYRLHRAGYQAYLVGGGVRDLLVGRRPKDFDISTDAHPHQVKRLFRNCRLIGRRFRLAHVHFGDKIVEVSTFRRRSDPVEGETAEDLLIRSDNTFGNAEEDALRRDFTINGLFYDIGTFSLIDYVGGLSDLHDRTIRTIGEPEIRFREDPVRMIRAVKFAARLEFTIEPDTFDAIIRNREELSKSAQPRLLEEIYRLLGGGAAEESFRLLHRTGLLEMLIPDVAAFIEAHGGADSSPAQNPLWRWLRRLDVMKEDSLIPGNAVLLAVLLGEMAFEDATDEGAEPGYFPYETEERLRAVLADIGAPRRDTERIFQIYRAQRRLIGGRGRRFSPKGFVLKNYFSDAFQFFTVYVEATGRDRDALERWQSLAGAAPSPSSVPPERRRRRRRRRRGGREFGPADSPDTPEGSPEDWEPGEDQIADQPGPAPVTGPKHADEDEDSQIRFLGWSDQPEILRPARGGTTPDPASRVPAPGGARSENRGGWRGNHAGRVRSHDRRPSGPAGGGGAPHRGGGPAPSPSAAGSTRRDGRRGGRRRPRRRD